MVRGINAGQPLPRGGTAPCQHAAGSAEPVADKIQENRVKKIIRVAALGGAVALALAACGSAPEDSSSPSASAGSSAAASDFKGCIVSDSGGFNDKSFNESGLNGLMKSK